MIRILTIAALLVAISGCATRIVDFTLISTKNFDLSRAAEFKRTRKRVNGEDVRYIVIFIPTGNPSVKEAIDRALEKVPGGVALLDGVVESQSWYIPYIWGENKIVVEGAVLVDPRLRAASGQVDYEDGHYVISMDEEGNVDTLDVVSDAEYFRSISVMHSKTL